MTFLVLGATGTTGRRVAERLRAREAVVRAASRHGPVRFDWSDASTWPAAVTGAEAVYLMLPHESPLDPAFLRLAAEQGVRRLVLLSSRGIEEMGDQRLLGAERLVKESGLEWTILRPDWFDQNFDEGFFRPAIEAGALAVPVGDARMAFVDAGDIAEVAVVALTEDGHTGQTLDVTGPEALSFAEAVAMIDPAVRFRGDPEGYAEQQAALGLPEEQTAAEIEAYGALRGQRPAGTVERLTGRPPIAFGEYVARAWPRS